MFGQNKATDSISVQEVVGDKYYSQLIKDGKIVLHPENDFMEDMIFDNVQILGIVKGLIRKF